MAKGDIVEEIINFKNQNGKDILVYGGAGFASSLIKHGLIDEYHLIINSPAMSAGMNIFNLLDGVQKFIPLQSKLYTGGKTVLSYKYTND